MVHPFEVDTLAKVQMFFSVVECTLNKHLTFDKTVMKDE